MHQDALWTLELGKKRNFTNFQWICHAVKFGLLTRGEMISLWMISARRRFVLCILNQISRIVHLILGTQDLNQVPFQPSLNVCAHLHLPNPSGSLQLTGHKPKKKRKVPAEQLVELHLNDDPEEAEESCPTESELQIFKGENEDLRRRVAELEALVESKNQKLVELCETLDTARNKTQVRTQKVKRMQDRDELKKEEWYH
ncbi:hypothetical protein CAPTEDRAFT_210319 [Capitella teleta]|uniref:Uncharacterized protein n=1 Tax=Capitella teleta TaxID=283909 RepID=N1PB71_CAPTE|nr:hypothetical protein CAPTEDRAFT_210319 [Capitella teleta]|eukprot:ELU18846.1 hypothetical protein CAPTEDRAFT_210319 [Capitella teleta]